jgi:hypothetical protein
MLFHVYAEKIHISSIVSIFDTIKQVKFDREITWGGKAPPPPSEFVPGIGRGWGLSHYIGSGVLSRALDAWEHSFRGF